MIPKDFKESNLVIAESQDEYNTLKGFIDPLSPQKPIVTCWQFESEEEKQRFLETGEIWITNLTFGAPYFPIMVSGYKPLEDRMMDIEAKQKEVEEKKNVIDPKSIKGRARKINGGWSN